MGTFDESAHPRTAAGRFAATGRGEAGLELSANVVAVSDLVKIPLPVTWVLSDLRDAGMRPMLVGGSVRDALLEEGSAPKDFDFEVFGANQEDLERVLSGHGRIDTVGRQFGMTQMRVAGHDLDFSLPRHDNRTGTGHRGFEVETDSNMSFAEAATRRDFTVNAISWDPGTGELVDPLGGLDDLEARRLRVCSEQFGEDPLRPLRGAQFAARFDMELDDDAVRRCRALAPQCATLPDERVAEEFAKLSRAGSPGNGLKAISDIGWDSPLGLEGHLGGDVRTAADRLPGIRPEASRPILLGALLTRRMGPGQAQVFLSRSVVGSHAQAEALELSRRVPLPHDAASARSQAHGGVSIRSRADMAVLCGEDPAPALRLAESLGVADAPQRDLLGGRDVMVRTKARPGPWMGELLSRARQAQDDGLFGDGDDALARAHAWLDGQPLPG